MYKRLKYKTKGRLKPFQTAYCVGTISFVKTKRNRTHEACTY